MRRETSPEEEALEELRRLKGREPPGRKKRPPWVRYIAAVLLAAACIGGAELTACRFFAPALYEERCGRRRIGPRRRRAGPWRPPWGREPPPPEKRGKRPRP